GIRDKLVTGVQTCALPICKLSRFALAVAFTLLALLVLVVAREGHHANSQLLSDLLQSAIVASAAACALWVTGRSTGYLRRLWLRSEERRVGKECMCGWLMW